MFKTISNFIWGIVALAGSVLFFMTEDALWGFISLALAVYYLYFRGYREWQESKKNKNIEA